MPGGVADELLSPLGLCCVPGLGCECLESQLSPSLSQGAAPTLLQPPLVLKSQSLQPLGFSCVLQVTHG